MKGGLLPTLLGTILGNHHPSSSNMAIPSKQIWDFPLHPRQIALSPKKCWINPHENHTLQLRDFANVCLVVLACQDCQAVGPKMSVAQRP